MKQIGWEKARAGDVVRSNGQELHVVEGASGDVRKVRISFTPEDILSLELSFGALGLLGATLHRPAPELREIREVGLAEVDAVEEA